MARKSAATMLAGSLLILLGFSFSDCLADDAVDRLTEERLGRVHRAIESLKASRKELPREGDYQEFRTNLHVHSKFSHDSRGQIEDIVAAAKRAGTQIVMFTEHPADHYDFVIDGHQGMRDGVLLIPGAETQGMLVYPQQSVKGLEGGTPQEFSNIVTQRGGMTFLSHLEERMDWEIAGITGVEIYNTHFDFKGEPRLISSMKNPLWLMKAADLFQRFPQESLAAIHDYPESYLKRWDALCMMAPHTGVSANDAHQNVGIQLRAIEGGKVRVEDALGEKVVELDGALVRSLLPQKYRTKVEEKSASLDSKVDSEGEILFKAQLDPYENSLRHVGTHLLMKSQTREEAWDALEHGRAFVAFDWIADSRGFDYWGVQNEKRSEMGSSLDLASPILLQGKSPLSGRWKIFRSGEIVHELSGDRFDFSASVAGNYRVELWLEFDGESKIWILSNPIYVKDRK